MSARSLMEALQLPAEEATSLQRAEIRRLRGTFWLKVDAGADTECWPWTGRIHRDGYGQVKVDEQARHAHIISWLIENRVSLEGKEVDHICKTRSCVNPQHLRLQTHRENTLRNSGPVARKYREARGLEEGVLEEDLVEVKDESDG